MGNATIKQQRKAVCLNTKEQYMKESNILAGNVAIKQRQKEILLATKGQYMKELDSLKGIVINNIQILQITKEIFIYNIS